MTKQCLPPLLVVVWLSGGCTSEPALSGVAGAGGASAGGAGVGGANAGGASLGGAGAGGAGAGGAQSGAAGAVGGASGGVAGGNASGGNASGGAQLGGTGGGPTGSSGCDPNWLFCDDFESYAPGASSFGSWSPADNYGAWDIGVADDRAFNGERAAFFSVEVTGRAFVATREPFPIAGNDFYGRYWIYFDDLPGQGVGVHWDIISALADAGDDGNYRWGGMWGHMMANYHPGDCWGNATNLVPVTGKWQCIEWRFDGPNNALYVWLDGEQATIQTTGGGCVEGDGQRTWLPPAEFLQLQIGWAHYQNQLQGNQVWIDDVVVDDERIGCQ